MWFFTIRAEQDTGQTVKEVDIPASQFLTLFQEIEIQLKAAGSFSTREELLKRLVPESEKEVDKLEFKKFEADISALGGLEYDVHTGLIGEEKSSSPLSSLSLWFCSLETGSICSFTFPIWQLFQSAKTHLIDESITKATLNADARWNFRVFLKGQGPLFIPKKHRSSTLLLLIQPESTPNIEKLESQTEKTLADIMVTERKALVVPAKRPWQDYQTTFIGIRQRGDLRILISKSAFEDLWEKIDSTIRNPRQKNTYEVGGFLMGDVYEDNDRKSYIDINKIFSVEMDDMMSFTWLLGNYPEKAQEVLEKIKQTCPDKNRLGWYHAHLSYAQVTTSTKSELRTNYIDMSRYDFSASDKDLHHSLFTEPWQVALVADLQKKKLDFYQLKRGDLEPCQGYYIYTP